MDNIQNLYSTSDARRLAVGFNHYSDVMMGRLASQITSLTVVYSTVYSDADQRKHQGSASLAFMRGIHRGPVNSPHKWPVTRKIFPFDDVIMRCHEVVTCGFIFPTPFGIRYWGGSVTFLVKRIPGIHFTNGLYADNTNRVHVLLLWENKYPTGSQFLSFHDTFSMRGDLKHRKTFAKLMKMSYFYPYFLVKFWRKL